MPDWLTRLDGSETNLLVCNCPCRSCGGVVVHRLQIQLFLAGAAAVGAVEQGVTAAACERVDIAGNGAFAVHAGSACWMVQLWLLCLTDRPNSDCFQKVAWMAMLPTQPPSLAGG